MIFFTTYVYADSILRHELAPHILGASLNCFHNIVITSTATDVTFQFLTHYCFVNTASIAINDIDGAHHHARRTEATL